MGDILFGIAFVTVSTIAFGVQVGIPLAMLVAAMLFIRWVI